MPRRNSNARYSSERHSNINTLAEKLRVPGAPSVLAVHSFGLVSSGSDRSSTVKERTAEPVYYRRLKGFSPGVVNALAAIGINGIDPDNPFVEVGFKGIPPKTKRLRDIRCRGPELTTSTDGRVVITTKINPDMAGSVGNLPNGRNQRLDLPDIKKYNSSHRFNVALGHPEDGSDLSELKELVSSMGNLLLDRTVRTELLPK